MMFLTVYADEDTADKLTIYFFGSSTCGECKEIKDVILMPLEEKYPQKLSIEYHDVDDENSLQFVVQLEEYFKISDPSPQELFFPDTFLIGYESIMASAEELILAIMESPQRWNPRWEKDSSFTGTGRTITREEREALLRGEKTGPLDYLRDLGMLVIGILCIVFRKKRFAAIVGQLILGAVFVIAGRKVGATKEIADVIAAYGILPESLIVPASVIMPWTELITGLMLLGGLFPKAGATVITAMNVVFIPALLFRTAVVASNKGINFFAVSFNCGCGLGENLGWILILRDAGYLLIGLSIIFLFQFSWNIKSVIPPKK
jgi:uncharacterized membrane protein YphA (DoxX/SURF4 family)